MSAGLEDSMNRILETIDCTEFTAVAGRTGLNIVTKTQAANLNAGRKSVTRKRVQTHKDVRRSGWATVTGVIIDVGTSPTWLPFLSDKPNGEEPVNLAGVKQHFEQLTKRAAEVFRYQHRQCLVAIAIGGSMATFIRFDRVGAVVSRPFDYIRNPQRLGNFFYRLFRVDENGMSVPRHLRGHDPTAVLACRFCTELFRGLPQTQKGTIDPVALAGLKNASIEDWPIYCLSIESPWSSDSVRAVRPDDQVETHRVLVGRPLFSSTSLFGRGTRGFVGWDLDTSCAVFVKDSWRSESPSRHTELEIYHQLWDGDESLPVKETHIPTVLGGGDVTNMSYHGRSVVQRTRTQELTDYWELAPRVHTRIVMKEIGRRLEDFDHPYELAAGVYGALLAHQRAWEKRKILHRDVSINNILLLGSLGDSVGLLCDWDLAITAQKLEDSTQYQTGTWQFMSALLQRCTSKRHEVSDDLESFLHVLTWSAVRYYLPNYSDRNTRAVRNLLWIYFDVTNTESWEKFKALCVGDDIADDLTYCRQEHPLNLMRQDLIKLVQEHYKSLGVWPPPCPIRRPMPGGRVVNRKVQPDAARIAAILGPSAIARNIGMSNAVAPTLSADAAPSMNLSDDPTTSSDSVQPSKPSPNLNTPATSPLCTHADFVAKMSTYLKSYRWFQLNKYTKPLSTIEIRSSIESSGGTSSARDSSSSNNGDMSLRPSKQAKLHDTSEAFANDNHPDNV